MSLDLWEKARRELRLDIPGMPPDTVVWEHSARVARLTPFLLSIPELPRRTVNEPALTAACLFHDIGWVLQVQKGEMKAADVLLRPTPEIFSEIAADWIDTCLSKALPPGSARIAAQAVRSANHRNTELTEALLLAEADNLDQIGPQCIGMMVRKQRREGKTLDDLMDAFERQEEYHYWQARIKESLRFPSVRALAHRRCEAMRRFMRDLRAVLRLEDLNGASPPVDRVNQAGDPARPQSSG